MTNRPAAEEHIALAPRPRALIHNAKDGTWLRLITDGKFISGYKKESLWLPSYYLALHCVTNAQYKRFLDDTGHQPPTRTGGESVWNGTEYPPKKANHPVVCVTNKDAQAYSKWAGLRLPSSKEREKGARGKDGRKYPWGEGWDPKMCQNYLDNGNESTCSVWDYPEGDSPWRLRQMAGNVKEWCRNGFAFATCGSSWESKDCESFSTYFAKVHIDFNSPFLPKIDRGGAELNCGFRCAKDEVTETGVNSKGDRLFDLFT